MGSSDNIIIVNEEELNEKIAKIVRDGKEKLLVVADFGRTFTKCFIDGQKIPTSFAQIREKPYLGEEYQKKANELFDKYHPIEVDSNLDSEEKIPTLTKWWKDHLELMVEYNLTKEIIINNIVKKDLVPLRNGFEEFVLMLDKDNIQLIIVSQGVGDIYIEVLKQKKLLKNNLYFITNLFEFDQEGKAKKVKDTIIHSYNKHRIDFTKFDFYSKIKDKQNVILLGDSLEDLGIIRNLKYNNLIKIGFLNEGIEENLAEFKKNFDVIILNDSDMDFVNELLKKII